MEQMLPGSKKRIFIAIQYLEIGGAERSLIGLLNAIDYTRYEVDLFVYRHTGEFMDFIPKEVHLLPEIRKYSALSRSMREILKEGYWDIALGRLCARVQARHFQLRTQAKESIAVFQYVASYTTLFLPSLDKLGEYDLAISFLIPHNIVRDKVRSKQKWAWIHTDYSFVEIDIKKELPIWSAYDRIISISEAVSKGFLSKFPSLNKKLLLIENILSEKMVREQSCVEIDEKIFCGRDVKLCTVGRFSYPKAIDRAVLICKKLVDCGMDIIWYVVGYGGDEQLIRKAIYENRMERYFVLLGKQMNPYPYIKSCDIYVQPSRYEGKAVTVREAQILEKPVVITNFPTASSQLIDGVDGIIVPNDVDGAAKGLMAFIKDVNKRDEIATYLHTHHYGNEEEVNKVYQMLEGC